MKISDITAQILAREGGYVDDPDDRGGPTNFGVTLNSLQRFGSDLNGDGRIDRADVKLLGKDQAAKVLEAHFFHAPNIDLLPEALQPSVYDMYVNAGSTAVRLLQKLLNDLGADLVADGVIGAHTVKAAKSVMARLPQELVVDAYGVARRNHYYALADKRRASRKYARTRDGGKGGWIIRAEEFISPRFHLTLDQHAQRVASWG